MDMDPTSLALGALFGYAIGALSVIGWGIVLDARAKRRKRKDALERHFAEMERGGR